MRRQYPDARIDVVVYPSNGGILDGNPDIDRVFVHPTRETWQGWRHYIRFLAMLNARRYDLGIECSPYQWWTSLLCGIPRRLHLDMPIPYWFFPIGDRPWSKRHAIENMATLVKPLNLAVDTSQVIVTPTKANREGATRFLEEHDIAPETLLLGIHPGGEGFRGLKRWGVAEFAETARILTQHHGARVLIFGGCR